MRDIDDICMEYDDLVEAGEIDPDDVSLDEYIQDEISSSIDRAMDYIDMER